MSKSISPRGRCVRTLVTHAELLCRIQRAFASRAGVCAACVHRVQTWLVACIDARIAASCVCVHPARSARTRDRHASRISIGRCACASLRDRTAASAMRPRNRVERSAPLTIGHYTRVKEWTSLLCLTARDPHGIGVISDVRATIARISGVLRVVDIN